MATIVGQRLFVRSALTARLSIQSARHASATLSPFAPLSGTITHAVSRLHSTAAPTPSDNVDASETLSAGSNNNDEESVDIRTQLLDAALAHVGSLGWTKDTIAAGARDLGLSPASHGIVSGGAVELVYHWMDKGNADLETYLTANALADTTERNPAEADDERQVLLKGLRYRLAYTKPVVWTWPQAMALGAEPHNLAETLARLSQISDLVCRFADQANTSGTGSGKQASGLAKHPAAVGAAYAAAELYMLTDYSENFEDTWTFLERRIDDAGSVSQNASGVLSVLGAAAAGAQAVASGVRSLDPSSAIPGLPGLPMPPLPRPSQVKSLAKMVRQASFDTAAMTGNQTLVQTLHTIDQQVSPFGSETTGDVKNENVDAAATSSTSSSKPEKASEKQEKELILERVVLPDDQSLFGLLAMDVGEAAALVRFNNPEFTVLKSPAKEEYEVLRESRVVRLMFNVNNVVVDVARE